MTEGGSTKRISESCTVLSFGEAALARAPAPHASTPIPSRPIPQPSLSLAVLKSTVQAYFLMKPTRVATPFPASALVLRIDTRGNIWLYWGAACIGGGCRPEFFFVEPLLMPDG